MPLLCTKKSALYNRFNYSIKSFVENNKCLSTLLSFFMLAFALAHSYPHLYIYLFLSLKFKILAPNQNIQAIKLIIKPSMPYEFTYFYLFH